MTDLRNRWIRVAMAAVLLLAGCSTDALREDLPDGEESDAPSMYIRLQMDLQGRGISRAGSGEAGGTGETGGTGGSTPTEKNETPGTSNENAVRAIDLLVCDAASGKLLEYRPLSDAEVDQVNETSEVNVAIYIPKGSVVHIYAAVNMTERMRLEFQPGKKIDDLSFVSAGADCWDVINDFVPRSDGKQQTLESLGDLGFIPMTGQFEIDGTGGKEITITQAHASVGDALPITANVSRIVAKVHVLATPETEDDGTPTGYVRSRSANDLVESIGWIHQSNVRYMINGANKSTYLFPQPNEAAAEYPEEYPWKDKNMDLAGYLISGIDYVSKTPAWAKDFVYYNGMSLHKENIRESNHFSTAELYDETRLNHTIRRKPTDPVYPDRYVAGQYCLENYFDILPSKAFEDYRDDIPMVTHVSIAAKLTPRWIVILKNYVELMDAFVQSYKDNPTAFFAEYGLTEADFGQDDLDRWNAIKEKINNDNGVYKTYFTGDEYLYRKSYRIIRADNEQDANDWLNWSLKFNKRWSKDPNDFEHDKYPDGTFYVYDRSKFVNSTDINWTERYLYLTAGAFNEANGENIDIKAYSVPHLGGWGYYYTYIDQLQQTTGGKTPFTASQVTRNTYYLITVGNFGVPGGSVSQPEYIKVNTEPVGWDYVGRGDVELH